MPAKEPKPSDPNWKTGEQLEFLLENWPRFKQAQDAKKLDQFWDRIFAEWHTRWPTTVAPGSFRSREPLENVRLMLQKERRKQIKSWFNNRCRGTDSAKSGRGKMKLEIATKRKLAPVQAYCAYAWESTLRAIAVTRWEQEKASMMIPDDEDPDPEDEDSDPGDDESEDADRSTKAIPLAFKLKIAKEVYSQLSDEEKKAINVRREEDQKRQQLPVYKLADAEDRIAKLSTHKRNRPIVPGTMNHILKNLENQAGCLSFLLVASVDPDTGAMGIQKFCQGRTAIGGLNFEAMYGEDWEANVELKFGEWASQTFGGVDTDRRGLFTLSKTSTVSLQSSIASLQAPVGVVRSETSIPVVAPPLQPVISPTPATTSRKTQPAATKEAGSRSVATPDPNPTLPPEESTPSFHVLTSANTSVTRLQTTTVSGLPGSTSTSVLNPLTPDTACTTSDDITLLSQAETVVQVAQVSPILASQILENIEPTQLVVTPAQLTANPPLFVASRPLQNAIESSKSRAVSVSPSDITTQSGHRITPTSPRSTTNTPPIAAAKSAQRYRTRGSVSTTSRRDSIDGVPEIGLVLPVTTKAPLHENSVDDDTSETIVDLSDFVGFSSDTDDRSHVSSSQKTLDGCRELSPPPSSQRYLSISDGEADSDESQSSSSDVETPYVDKADLPSWMTKARQWKYLTSTRGGPAWEKLLEVYMQQERRLEFREMGTKLTLEGRPSKIKDYIRYAHKPRRGNNLTLPSFGEEVITWWEAIQPDWRRDGEEPPHDTTAWSYILSGGSKGTFLIVMCLAWWHRAYRRYLKSARGSRRTHVEASYFDLPDHDTKWSELVKDLTSVMEKAQSCDIPTSTGKRKRGNEPASSWKKTNTLKAQSKP